MTVNDTVDDTTVSLSASTVQEGPSANYEFTAMLSHVSHGDTVITTDQGTITIHDGQTIGTLTVAPVPPNDEDPYLDSTSLTATITNATGGNFENLVVGTASATAYVEDTITTNFVTLHDVVVLENQTIVYTAQVDYAPIDTPFTVKLNNGVEITFEPGHLTASSDPQPAQGEDVYLDGGSTQVWIASASGGNFEQVDIAKYGKATVTVNDTIDDTTVNLSASTVQEGPSANYVFTATLSNVSHGDTVITTDRGIITIGDGQTTGTLTIPSGNGEDVYLDGSQLTATISSATGGNFEKLTIGTALATAQVTDTLDPTTVNLSASTVQEGASANFVFTATLSNVSHGDTVITTDRGIITIGDGQTTGTLTIPSGNGEDVYLDGSQLTATISNATGGDFENLVVGTGSATAHVGDTIDPTTVNLSASTVQEGASANFVFTATLSNVSHGDTVITTDQGIITIGDGQTTGTLTLPSGNGEDVYLDGSQLTATISNATGGDFENLVVGTGIATAQVTDTINPVTATLTTSATSISEYGGSITYTVTLSSGLSPFTPNSPLDVLLSNGEHVMIAANASSGSVTRTYTDAEITNQASIVDSINSVSGGTEYEQLLTAGTTTVPVAYSPVGNTLVAVVDDEGLARGIAGGTGDDTTTSAANFVGTLTGSGGNGALTFGFANLIGGIGTVGLENVSYGWSSNILTATITSGARAGLVLFTIDVTPSTGAYTLNLNLPVKHAAGSNENDASLALQYGVTDSANNNSLGTLNITFDDDAPNNFVAQSMVIENGANSIGSGALNFYQNIGADGGSVVFTGTNNSLLQTTGAVTVKSGGLDVHLFGFGTDTLTGKTGADALGNGGTTIFTVTLLPSTTDHNQDVYTVQFFRPLDDGSGGSITPTNFTSTSSADYKLVDDTTATNHDILVSASGGTGRVNGSNGGSVTSLGVGGGVDIGSGETLRFDFATGVTLDGNSGNNHITSASLSHYGVQGFTATIKNGGGTSAVRIVAFDADSDLFLSGDGGDVPDQITAVYLNGVLVPLASLTPFGTGYVINATNNDQISVFTSNGYSRVEVSYSSGQEFSVANVGYLTLDTGSSLPLSFNVTATDSDGDQSTGSIAITTNPVTSTITGTASDDLLVAGNSGETVNGLAGNDTIIGGLGADTLDGGTHTVGGDTVSYQNSSAGVTVDLTLVGVAQTSGGDASGDKLSNFENVIGSNFADTITGDGNANTLIGLGGNDMLNGGGGDDILIGGAGADTLNGGTHGSGGDTASYVGSSAGVTVNLTLGGAQTSAGDANGDILINIENLTGSNFADILIGDNNANTLTGGSGADQLTGGGGADRFHYNSPAEGIDHLTDFNILEGDVIEISASAFGGGLVAGSDATGKFSSSADNTFGASDRLHFNTATHTLLYDADGNGGASTAIALAVLENGATVDAAHIKIVA
ncbi:beta strand repeat-containing protein [Bradyrhizobium liaoningense]|uniref:beta strand repeat-containing protein n=1 Tax=Bradyrhizobium liaoningense TaxID=43992 RepID=UPI001BAD1FBA|nr:calcium-binding protein [Bradyrhizobium liaoningense]